MIRLTKINGDEVIINTAQIQAIEFIPEAKIIYMNKEFIIVKENADEILEKVIDFNAKVYNFYKIYSSEKI